MSTIFVLEIKGAKNNKIFIFLNDHFSVMGCQMNMIFGVFSKTIVRLLKSIVESFMANFHFPETTGSLTVALNSSCCQKLAILVFTFAVNTFLSSTENGGNRTDSNVFVILNVGGYISQTRFLTTDWM